MGEVVGFRRHTRASAGSDAGSSFLAAISAKTSKVISSRPRSAAKRTTPAQCGPGMPLERQPLTVESDCSRAVATAPVPPAASIMAPHVNVMMPQTIVRTVRTSQGFARRETTFSPLRVPIRGMVDHPEVIGPRLRALRIALGFHTQIKFAKAIGVEKNTYNPWEKGSRPLTFEGACLIRRKFKIPLDYLFFGEIGELPVRIHEKIQQAA